MTLRHRMAAAIAGLAALVGTASLIAHLFMSPVSAVVDAAGIRVFGGKAFTTDVGLISVSPRLFEIRSDHGRYPVQSGLVLLEDGKSLGPAHAMRSDIEQLGAGRYSHWVAPGGGMLFFSASDNSDPRSNGRKYEIVARPVPVPLLMASILLLPLMLLALQRLWFPQQDITAGLIAVVSVVGAVAWGSLFFDYVTLAPDSTTYIRNSFIVPLGYPLFLDGVTAIWGSLDRVAAIQVVILVAACTILALSAGEIAGSGAVALAVLLLVLCCLPMFWWADWILSEGLFTPLALLNLAAAFLLIVEQRVRYVLLLVATAALMLFVRPAGYYVVAGIAFLMIAQRGRFYWMLRWACVPFVVCTVATILFNVGVRGSSAPSQVGRLLFPTVAFLFEPQFITGPYQSFVPAIEEALKPHRDGYRAESGRAARIAYLANDYNARLTDMDAAMNRALANAGGVSFERLESVYISFFLATISHRPVEFVTQIAEQLIEAWDFSVLLIYPSYRSTYLANVHAFSTRLQEISEKDFPLSRSEARPRTDRLDGFPGRMVEVFDKGYHFICERRLLIYLVGIVTLLAMPIAMFFRRQSLFWLSLGYCGVMIHGSMLLTATVTVFIFRYAVPIDPIILVAGAIMIAGTISWGRQRLIAAAQALPRRPGR